MGAYLEAALRGANGRTRKHINTPSWPANHCKTEADAEHINTSPALRRAQPFDQQRGSVVA